MRTRAGTVLLVAIAAIAFGAIGACSDDGDGGGDSDGGEVDGRDEQSAEDGLGDDPTDEECSEAVRTVFGRMEVPAGFDPTDGVDDDERAAAEEAVVDAGEGVFDPTDNDHPCVEMLSGLSAEESAALIGDIDREVLVMVASLAQPGFTEIEDEL